MKFSLGQIVITSGASEALSQAEVYQALDRHVNCDWGDLCDEDKELNDYALNHEERLLSVYNTNDGTKFYIITEWDRSVTTVLLPSEY